MLTQGSTLREGGYMQETLDVTNPEEPKIIDALVRRPDGVLEAVDLRYMLPELVPPHRPGGGLVAAGALQNADAYQEYREAQESDGPDSFRPNAEPADWHYGTHVPEPTAL